MTDQADVVLPRRAGRLSEDGGCDRGQLFVVLPVADLGGDDEVWLQCGDLLEACTADRADRDGVRGEFLPRGSEVVGQTGLAVVDVADERGFEEKDGVGEAVVERDDPLGCCRDFGASTESVTDRRSR